MMYMENYQGVKFKTIFLSTKIVQDPRLEELKKWCAIFDENNLAPPYSGGSAGNLSFRINSGENRFVITGSGLQMKGELVDESFVQVDECDIVKKEIRVHGIRNPSSESMLHYSIYQMRADAMAIFHGHSTEILSKAESLKLPVTNSEQPYGSCELVGSVLEILDNNNFIIMKNHGFISLGENINKAGELSISISGGL